MTGGEYKFTVTAYNYNGAGTTSSTYSFYSCVYPSDFSAPYRTASTTSTITIGWTAPSSNGGCSVLGYAIYMDDGTGTSTFAEVNTALDPAVRDIPSLDSLTITTLTATDVGTTYVFYASVFTEVGSYDSD
jgi:hypothetical protein